MEMNQAMPAQPIQAPPVQASQSNATAPTSEDAALFNQLFNVTDKNGSGDINKQEFGDLLQYAREQNGAANSPISSAAVQQLHMQADASGDGTLDRNEFTDFLKSAMTQGSSSTAAPAAGQQMEAGPGTGTMVDPSDTAEAMQGTDQVSGQQCGYDHGSEVTKEQAEALYAEYQGQVGPHSGSCATEQNQMIEFRNHLQNNKGMSFEDAEATVAALRSTPAEAAAPTGSAVPGAMDFLATNVTPISQEKLEGNKPVS